MTPWLTAAALTLLWLLLPALVGAAAVLLGSGERFSSIVTAGMIVLSALFGGHLGLRLVQPPHAALGVWPLGVAALVAYAALWRTVPPQALQEGERRWDVLLLGPLDEEIWFRGVLLVLLGLSLPAIALSSLLFAMVHLPSARPHGRLKQFAGDALFGTVAATSLALSGTIVMPIVLHVVVNALSLRRPRA